MIRNPGFNIDRAFIGYEGFLPKGFSAKVVMHTETVYDGEGHMKSNAYLKNAQVDWRGNGFAWRRACHRCLAGFEYSRSGRSEFHLIFKA